MLITKNDTETLLELKFVEYICGCGVYTRRCRDCYAISSVRIMVGYDDGPCKLNGRCWICVLQDGIVDTQEAPIFNNELILMMKKLFLIL